MASCEATINGLASWIDPYKVSIAYRVYVAAIILMKINLSVQYTYPAIDEETFSSFTDAHWTRVGTMG